MAAISEIVNQAEPRTHGPKRASRPSALFWIIVLAIAVRLVLHLAAHGAIFAEAHHLNDASFFNETSAIAGAIASGHGFSSPMITVAGGEDAWTGPSAWISPVYPYFVAAMFRMVGLYSRQAFLIVVLVQCVLSALTCIPIVKIGERTVGRRAAYLAAVLWAVFPWFSHWAIAWIWEITLSALLFAWLFWFALELGVSPTTRKWIAFGALWGFAMLVNPALLTLLPVSIAWIAYQNRGVAKPWFRSALIGGIVCLAVISPWLIRNRVVFGEWVFLRSNFGFEFWLGNIHGSNGLGWAGNHPCANPKEFKAYREMGELAYVRMKTREAFDSVRRYPGEFGRFTGKRLLYFWSGGAMRYNYRIEWWWAPWSFAALSVLGIGALMRAYSRGLTAWPMFLGAMLLYPLPYYITYPQARYRHVLEPLMVLLVAWAVMRIADAVRACPREATS